MKAKRPPRPPGLISGGSTSICFHFLGIGRDHFRSVGDLTAPRAADWFHMEPSTMLPEATHIEGIFYIEAGNSSRFDLNISYGCAPMIVFRNSSHRLSPLCSRETNWVCHPFPCF